MDKYLQYLMGAGVVVALFGSMIISTEMVNMVAILIGLTIGILNIDTKETLLFLVATIAITVVGTSTLIALPVVGSFLGSTVKAFIFLASAAAIPVALKTIWDLAT